MPLPLHRYRWHIGNCKEAYLPHKRGFEQHIGIWHSGADKFDYNHEGKFDLHKNADPYPDVIGTYSTVAFKFYP